MSKITKALIFINTILLIIAVSLVTYTGYALAQVPDPYVPCNEVRDPTVFNPDNEEFNSLRPYQASPCVEEPTELEVSCGNDILIKNEYRVTPLQATSCNPNPDGSQECFFEFDETDTFSVTLQDAELPIVGNTQLVPNSQNDSTGVSNELTSGQKVNEYVSWYLQGDTYLAENPYPEYYREGIPIPIGIGGANITLPIGSSILTEESQNHLLNYAGPSRKLLPLEIQHRARIETINSAGQEDQRHNQIVACTLGVGFPLLGQLGGIPIPCNSQEYENALYQPFIQEIRLRDWQDHLPPLESNYNNFRDYWAAYRRWRGDSCLVVSVPSIIPIIGDKGFMFCAENPLRPDYWSNLFPYIPMANTNPDGLNKGSTEDRIGELEVSSDESIVQQPTLLEGSDITSTNVEITIEDTTDRLYFAHMEETTEMLSLLQETYVSKDSQTFNGYLGNTSFYDTQRCDLLDVRWNSGDDLFGEYGEETIEGEVTYSNNFSCTFGPPTIDQSRYDQCIAQGGAHEECVVFARTTAECERDAYTAVSVFTKSPKTQELWQRTVSNTDASVWRRFMPKLGPNGLNVEVKDLPGVTTANYSSSGDETLAGAPSSDRSGARAEIFIPHLGGIYEYFLKGLQDAFRPEELRESFLPGYPSGVTPGNGTCEPVPSGPCSVEELLPYFDNDPIKAANASQICNKESGGNPINSNLSCLDGGTRDFSIGLFQINLLAHCDWAFTDTGRQCYFEDDGTDCSDLAQNVPGMSGLNSCNAALRECIVYYLDPGNNIQKAYELSSGGTNFSGPWVYASRDCGIE